MVCVKLERSVALARRVLDLAFSVRFAKKNSWGVEGQKRENRGAKGVEERGVCGGGVPLPNEEEAISPPQKILIFFISK